MMTVEVVGNSMATIRKPGQSDAKKTMQMQTQDLLSTAGNLTQKSIPTVAGSIDAIGDGPKKKRNGSTQLVPSQESAAGGGSVSRANNTMSLL